MKTRKINKASKKYAKELDQSLTMFFGKNNYLKKRFTDVLIQAEMLGFPLSDILIRESKDFREALEVLLKAHK